jgi:hypothetical protein
MKPDKIHVFRNEVKPNIPKKLPFEELAAKAALHIATPWWSHWLTITGGGVAVLIGVTTVALSNSGKSKQAVVMSQKPAQVTLVSNSAVYDTLEADVFHGDTVYYNECTKIIVQKGGIADARGRAIAGCVKFLYREQRNGNTSNRHKATKSDGKELSNGLFEIRALAGEQILSNGIKVEFCTETSDPGYHWYQSINQNDGWDFLSNTDYLFTTKFIGAAKNPVVQNTETITEADVTQTGINQPMAAPRMHTPGTYTFHVDGGRVPYLAPYKNTIFEVLPGQDYNPDNMPEEFDFIKVKATNKPGIYHVTFVDNGVMFRCYAAPVLTNEKDYNDALEVYRNSFRTKDVAHKPKPQESVKVFRKISPVQVNLFGIYESRTIKK